MLNKFLIFGAMAIGFILGLALKNNEVVKLKTQQADAIVQASKELNDFKTASELQLAALKKQNYAQLAKLETQVTDLSASRDSYISELHKFTTSNHKTSTNPTTGTAGPSKSDQATFDMFIQLLDGHTRELSEVGAYAEKLRAAGLLCEAQYDVYANKSPQH